MIKIKEIGGDLFVGESKYYKIVDGMVLVNKQIAEEVLGEVDISSNNISTEILKTNIRRYFNEKMCILPRTKINNNLEFILLNDIALTQKNFKMLFLNLDYFYNSIKEYINLTLNLSKSDSPYLSYIGYKSINNCVMIYENKEIRARVLDYTIILNGTDIKLNHNINNSTIPLDAILLEQIDNVLVKNLKFKKTDENTYETSLLTLKNSKEIYDTVIKRLTVLEKKMIQYNIHMPIIKKSIEKTYGNDNNTEHMLSKLLEALFMNMILYQKDLHIQKDFIQVNDRLDLTDALNVKVPRSVVEEVIINSSDPYLLLGLFKFSQSNLEIDKDRWERFKRKEEDNNAS